MKKILVPTDFSSTAQNAVNYAVALAKETDAQIILFHSYQAPVVPSEVPVLLPVDEIEKDVMRELTKIKNEIETKHSHSFKITCSTACGFPVEEINLFAEENNIDMIVIGMEGSGQLTEKLIGNITSALIKRAKCPVLSIDKNVIFRKIKRIALACDFHEIGNHQILEPLKYLAKTFSSEVFILNVLPELETAPTLENAVAGIRLDRALSGVNHSFYYKKDEDLVEGINHFVEDNSIDLVVMIPRLHGILKNIFQESNTKHMVFHTHTPILALHE